MTGTEGQERRKSDGEMMSRMEEWEVGGVGGEKRCKEMKDEGFQGRGKAVRQSAGLDDNSGGEKEQTDNPD